MEPVVIYHSTQPNEPVIKREDHLYAKISDVLCFYRTIRNLSQFPDKLLPYRKPVFFNQEGDYNLEFQRGGGEEKRLLNNLCLNNSSKSYIIFILQIIPRWSLQYIVFLTKMRKLNASVKLVIMPCAVNIEIGLEQKIIFWLNFLMGSIQGLSRVFNFTLVYLLCCSFRMKHARVVQQWQPTF